MEDGCYYNNHTSIMRFMYFMSSNNLFIIYVDIKVYIVNNNIL